MLLLLLILLSILIIFTLNIISIVKIKWNNSLFKRTEKECLTIDKNVIYEYDSYRYNLYNYIYNVKNENKFKKSKDTYQYTYYILLILIIISILLFIYNIYYKYDKKKIIFVVVIILYLFIYYYIGNLILNDYDKINSILKNESNNLYKYMNVYKILNTLMYLNDNDNLMDEVFDYNTSKIKNDKTLEEILQENIAKIHYISNEIEIEYIKSSAKSNKDYLKYISLNSISPYYFTKYFDKQYIIINENKYYLQNLLKENNIVNEKIKESLNISGENIKIEDNNYIGYYNNNKKLLLNENIKFKNEFEDIINKNIYIILLCILYIIYLLLFGHIIYLSVNNSLYLLILGIIIITLFTFLLFM